MMLLNLGRRELMKKQHRTGIVVKLIGMSALPLIVLGLVLSVYGQASLKKSLKSEIYDGLKSSAVAVEGAYDAAGEGDFTMLQSGNIIKGTFIVNNNYNLVDKLKENAGIQAALFYGDAVVVSSFTDEDGNRIQDLKADEAAAAHVLEKGEEYFSEDVKIAGKEYYGYYMPVTNEDGTVTGMIFTGKESAEVNSLLMREVVPMSVISIVITLAGLGVSVYFSGSLVKVLKKTIAHFSLLAEGNLTEQKMTKDMNRSDEIGDMAKGVVSLRKSLRGIIGNITGSVSELIKSAEGLKNTAVTTGKTSADVSKAIEEISKASSSQAEETEAAMTHVTDMGILIEEIVSDVEVLSQRADNMETSGKTVEAIIGEVNDYTSKTTEVVDRISNQTQTTNASAQEIRKAIEMIRSITEETTLLSLNASIEAARAGEQGKGFAVVATQIQKLADQSSQSAEQIEQIIHVLLEDSDKTVETMKEMVEIVSGQREKLTQAGERFKEVNDDIQESMDKIGGIREKSDVLDESRKQILDLFTNLAAESEENASSVEETTSSIQQLNDAMQTVTKEAEGLNSLAEELEKQIETFRMD